VAGNAAENEMDARALALCVAPCLAWHAPPASERRRVRRCPTFLCPHVHCRHTLSACKTSIWHSLDGMRACHNSYPGTYFPRLFLRKRSQCSLQIAECAAFLSAWMLIWLCTKGSSPGKQAAQQRLG
jgi:hypothetical protein